MNELKLPITAAEAMRAQTARYVLPTITERTSRGYEQIDVRHGALPGGIQPDGVQLGSFQGNGGDTFIASTTVHEPQKLLDTLMPVRRMGSLLLQELRPTGRTSPAQSGTQQRRNAMYRGHGAGDEPLEIGPVRRGFRWLSEFVCECFRRFAQSRLQGFRGR